MFNARDKFRSLCYQIRTYRGARELMIEDNLSSILDVGCGCPEKLKAYIFPVTDDITGIDMLDESSYEEYGITYHKVNLENSTLDLGRKFDMIVCGDVIEHINNPVNVLDLIKRHADEHTQIVMSTPDVATYVNINVHKGHVRSWIKDSFVDFLESFGFDVEKSHSYRQEVGDTAKSYYYTIVCLCKLKEVK